MELANTVGAVLGLFIILLLLVAIFSKKKNKEVEKRAIDKWMEMKRAQEKVRNENFRKGVLFVMHPSKDIKENKKSETIKEKQSGAKKKEIKQVYIGLPSNLQERVYWVNEKFRKNPLSFTPGGIDVVVEYCSGEVFGYNRIKFPHKYIRTFFLDSIKISESIFDSYDITKQLSVVTSQINRIFARKWKTLHEKESVPFEEIWHALEMELPWRKLEKYQV